MNDLRVREEFKSSWWSVRLPIGWQATESEECVTLEGKSRLGAVQISAARKDDGQVTDSDLRQFAVEQRGATAPFQEVVLPAFVGLYAERVEHNRFWREWWLRSGGLMVYVTYNVDTAFKGSESAAVDSIVNSLTPLANSKDSTD